MSKLLTSQEALKFLGLAKEVSPGVWKGNIMYIKWLSVDREILPRVVLGPRTFRYEEEACEKLLSDCKTKGIILTLKPS